MADTPQSRKPRKYTEEELRQLNEALESLGRPKVNEFGEPFGLPVPEVEPEPEPISFEPVPSFTLPEVSPLDLAKQPLGPPGPPSAVIEELQQFGTVDTSAEELKARREFEKAANDLFRTNLRKLRDTRAYEKIPELQDLTLESPDFTQRLFDYAAKQTIQQIEAEIGFVPGFAMSGYAEEGKPQQSPAILGKRLPISSPADLPPTQEPTLIDALSPQSRVGPEVARREEQLVQLKSADEMIAERGLDEKLHVDFAEKVRLERLDEDLALIGDKLSPEQKAQLAELQAKVGDKKQFEDIVQIGQIRAFEAALDKYMANESVAREKSRREAAKDVAKDIEELKDLLEGRAKPSRYKKHVVGEEPEGLLLKAFAPQIKEGKVPILTQIQKDYFKAYGPILEQAQIDILPYEIQKEEDPRQVTVGEEGPSAFTDKPEPISKEKAYANYKDRLERARPVDFYAVDFWEDPEKYVNEKGLWSWFNQSYPSGASVEGPGSVLMRWVAAPFNLMSTEIYETAQGRGVIGSLLNYELFDLPEPEVKPGSTPPLREPTESEKIAYGMDPKYAGHPYLRAVAENRFIGDDVYDLYWYNGYKDLAIVPGLLATVGDMIVTPGIPVGALPKTVSAAAKSVKAAKAVGMPVKISDVGADAVKAFAQSLADTSPLLEIVSKKTGVRLADPSELAALRATEFMEGANAYRAAKADVVKKAQELGTTVSPEEAHKIALEAARESLAPGTRGNSFLDYAGNLGTDWADNAAKNVGKEFKGAAKANDYRNRIYQVMKGISNQVPDAKKTKRLLEAFKANYLDDAYDISGEVRDVLKKIYNDYGPAGYARFLSPENFRFAQEGIVTALEASPLTRGTWKNLKHVTETLLVDPKDLAKLLDLVKDTKTIKVLRNVQNEAETKYGLHGSLDQRIEAGGGQKFTPKVGTYLELDPDQASKLSDIVDNLNEKGFLNNFEARSIKAPINLAGEAQILNNTPIISTDNMRRVINASIEEIAFNNSLGIVTEAFEGATAATKKALRLPLEARHLAASWPEKAFSKVWSLAKTAVGWSDYFPEDTPANVLVVLERLRGKLNSMNIKLRSDIKQLLNNPELQTKYFDEAWLAANDVTRDDAIVALSLGPKALRAQDADAYQQSILAVMTAKAQDLSLDFLAAFRPSSIQRSDIRSALSANGKQVLNELFARFDLSNVNGADDFVQNLQQINDELRKFVKDPNNFKDAGFVFQVADQDFPNIVAGFYYVQQQRKLKVEALNELAQSWSQSNSVDLVNALRITDEGENLTTLGSQIDRLANLAGRSRPTVGDMISARLNQVMDFTPDAKDFNPRAIDDEVKTIAEDISGILISGSKDDFAIPDTLLREVNDILTNPARASEANVLIDFYDNVTEIVSGIISSNRLNDNSLNDNLNYIDTILDAFLSFRIKNVQRGLSEDLTLDILASQLKELPYDQELISIISEAFSGIRASKKVSREIESSDSVIQLREALIGLFDSNPTAGYRVVKFIDSLFKWHTRSTYQQVLGGRLAFHIVNLATGPLLTWGTVGGRAALDSVTNSITAMKILMAGDAGFVDKVGLTKVGSKIGLIPMLHKTAVTDPFGRIYTYGDIYNIAFSEGALKSRTSVTLSARQYIEMLDDARLDPKYRNWVTKKLNQIYDVSSPFQAGLGAAAVGAADPGIALSAAASGVLGLPTVRRIGARPLGPGGTQLAPTFLAKLISDFTEYEDNIFRLATVIGALRRGDDPIQALGVGKKALLDYGSLTPVEKWSMTRFAMFYTFWRLNATNTFKTMLENPRRLVNISRAVEGGAKAARALAADDNMEYQTHELNFYKHSFMLSRPIINYIEGADRQSHYQVLPGVPILDGVTTVAQLLFAPSWSAVVSPIIEKATPITRNLAAQEPSYQWQKSYIDPRDMYILDKSAWGSWFWNVIIKEEPTGKPAVAGQEAWRGQVWTLSEPAMKRYLYFKNYVSQALIAPGIITNSSLPTTMIAFGTDPELTGRRFPQSRVEMALTVSGLKKDIGALPSGQIRTRLLKEMIRRIEALDKDKVDKKFKR